MSNKEPSPITVQHEAGHRRAARARSSRPVDGRLLEQVEFERKRLNGSSRPVDGRLLEQHVHGPQTADDQAALSMGGYWNCWRMPVKAKSDQAALSMGGYWNE